MPAGVAAAIEQAMHERGLPSVGVWAQVPHYVAAMSYPAASVALLDALEHVTGITIPARDLRREMVLQRERLDQLVEGNDEHREMVARLERIYDNGEQTVGPTTEGSSCVPATSSPPRSSASSANRRAGAGLEVTVTSGRTGVPFFRHSGPHLSGLRRIARRRHRRGRRRLPLRSIDALLVAQPQPLDDRRRGGRRRTRR